MYITQPGVNSWITTGSCWSRDSCSPASCCTPNANGGCWWTVAYWALGHQNRYGTHTSSVMWGFLFLFLSSVMWRTLIGPIIVNRLGTVQESKLFKIPGCFGRILKYDEVMPELNNCRFICFTSQCFDCRQMDVKFQILFFFSLFFLTPTITNETCYLVLEITWFGPR